MYVGVRKKNGLMVILESGNRKSTKKSSATVRIQLNLLEIRRISRSSLHPALYLGCGCLLVTEEIPRYGFGKIASSALNVS